MNKRETVMLAHVYEPGKHKVDGFYVSEKLDGIRCLWDGGITRNLLCSEVPFANTDKDLRYKNKIYATGLWTRYFKPIQAPSWFLDRLPLFPLDGELYLGKGAFQETMSITRCLEPDDRWKDIRYMAFDIPMMGKIFEQGRIKVPLFEKIIGQEVWDWAVNRMEGNLARERPHNTIMFKDTYKYMKENFQDPPLLFVRNFVYGDHVKDLERELERVLDKGGEGLMLRDPHSIWTPKRTKELLKYKGYFDDQGVVTGYTWGKEGKLLGLMGSIRVEWRKDGALGLEKKEFDLSGFTDEERRLCYVDLRNMVRMERGEIYTGDYDLARKMGEQCIGLPVDTSCVVNPKFPIGSMIRFRYRELTKDGLPKEARYFR